MSYYWIGDQPLAALTVVPTRHGEPVDLALYTGVSLLHVDPSGVSVDRPGSAVIDDGAVEIHFGGASWFQSAGLHRLRPTLLAAGGQERLDDIPVVVQADDGWHTLPSARSEWRDAPTSDVRLWTLLQVAQGQVLAYAPELEEDVLPPINYRLAQLQQARNLFNAGQVDPGSGDAGGDGFALTPFPLDWTIKQLLRPKSARPVAL